MEFVKKTYKPKEEKVKKLTNYMTTLKIVNGVKCDLFTKTIKGLIILVMLTGCSAEYHLKKAIKKAPNMAEISTHVFDTIVLRSLVTITDTFTTKSVDTITIQKEGVKTIVYRNHDVIQVRTIVQPDTIRITKSITLPPRIEYRERVKIPQKIGVGIGMALLLLLLLILLKK